MLHDFVVPRACKPVCVFFSEFFGSFHSVSPFKFKSKVWLGPVMRAVWVVVHPVS